MIGFLTKIHVDPKPHSTDTDRAYNAPVGGLSFNYNTTTAYFRPAESAGEKPWVSVDPDYRLHRHHQ